MSDDPFSPPPRWLSWLRCGPRTAPGPRNGPSSLIQGPGIDPNYPLIEALHLKCDLRQYWIYFVLKSPLSRVFNMHYRISPDQSEWRMAAGLRARARKRDDGWSGRGRSGQNERAPGATRDATNVSTVRVPPTSRAEASTKRGNPPQLLSRRSRRSWQKSVHAAQSAPVTVTGPKLSTWVTS